MHPWAWVWGIAAVNSVTYEEDRSRDLQDSVSWVKGKHSLKFGARYLWFQAATGESTAGAGNTSSPMPKPPKW